MADPVSEAWALLDTFAPAKRGVCRRCNRIVFGITRHHMVPARDLRKRPRANPNPRLNLIPVCRPCHDLIEASEVERQAMIERLTPTERAYVQTLEACGFDGRYRTQFLRAESRH